MAAVNVTISGVLCDKYGRTIMPVTLVGEATLTGLGVGGGPIIPPDGEKPPGSPPGTWGGANEPFPTPPISNVPGVPGYRPPGDPPTIWPGPGDPDFPGGPKPPEPVQPPISWKAVWAGPSNGWVVVGIPQFDHPTPSAE